MHELIRGLVPGLPDAARSRIVERAGGIPLYALETVRMLVTDGRLVANGGAYRMAGELADIAIPETLHSLIAARLDALEPTDRSLVQAAAVLGQSFTPAALAAVSAHAADELEPRLRSLARREILVHDADPRSPERGQYTFVQALVREVAYATLAKRDRKTRHVAAARYFESLGEDELVGALAAQYLAAHQNAPEGPEAEALATQARIALRAAGDRAESLGSPEQAAQFFESALDVTSDDRERAALLERAGTAADTAARHAVAQGHLERAVELYRTLGDRSATARATAILGRVIIHSFRLQEALAVLRAAAEEFVDLDSDPGLPRLLGQQARAEMLLQLDLEAAIRTCDRALALAERLDLVEVVADVLVTRGTALSSIGRSYEGAGAIEAGLRLATTHGLVGTEVRARTNISAPLGLQDQQAALEMARAGLAVARRIGNRTSTALLLGNLAAAALETGDWDQAAEELHGAMATFDGAERTVLLFFLAGFAAARGELTADQIAELDGRIEEAVREGRSGWENSRHGVRAMAAETEGRFGNIAGEMIDSARTDPFNAPATLSDAAIYALLAEDANRAREALDLLDSTGGHGQVISLARRACAAGLAALEGRSSEARGGLIEAYEAYRAAGLVRKQVLTGLLAATLLDPDDPRVGAVADETRAVLERLRARPYLAALDAAVARGAGRATTSAAPTPVEADSQAAQPA
jgi:tetratricopeptide (TPR) repeat protein